MKAILIDPEMQIVAMIDYSGDYKDIYKLIGCRIFTAVTIDNDDSIYIDDEGMFEESRFAWSYNEYKMVNKGLIVGCNCSSFPGCDGFDRVERKYTHIRILT